ncbi:MAG: ABC1 kinase family protein [Deltaproteobacteria bacterium]
MLKEAFQDLARLRQISTIVVRHGFGELLARSRIKDQVDVGGEAPTREELKRQSAARRFRGLLSDLGPTFIKLGQVLSTRADLLPAEVVDELRGLQDAAPPIPLEVVEAQIERALKKPAREAFAWIDPSPLASASIAQVHRARTHAGDEVVVKVQRPDIERQIETDLDLLRYLARALEAVIEEVGIYTPTGIVDEFDRAVHEELDFENEAKNIRDFFEKNQGRPAIVIPKVYGELSGRAVLTMSFLEGIKLTDVADPATRKLLAQRVVEESFHQLFDDGLFHADPHPGNLLYLADGRTAIIDFGLVGRLTPSMQQTLVMLTIAIALKDTDTVARILYRVGIPDSRTNLSAFKADIGAVLSRYSVKSLKDIEASTLLRDLLDLAVRYRIRIPKEYALLSRASVAAEGVLRQLDPDLDVAQTTLPYVRQVLFGQLNPGSLQGGLLKSVLRLQEMSQSLPTQLSQILLDLEGGKFAVNVQGTPIQELTDAVRRLSVVLLGGMLGASLVVGAFISISVSRREWSFHGVPVIGVVAIALGAMLFGAVATWYFVLVRLKKIRISRWFRRSSR